MLHGSLVIAAARIRVQCLQVVDASLMGQAEMFALLGLSTHEGHYR